MGNKLKTRLAVAAVGLNLKSNSAGPETISNINFELTKLTLFQKFFAQTAMPQMYGCERRLRGGVVMGRWVMLVQVRMKVRQ